MHQARTGTGAPTPAASATSLAPACRSVHVGRLGCSFSRPSHGCSRLTAVPGPSCGGLRWLRPAPCAAAGRGSSTRRDGPNGGPGERGGARASGKAIDMRSPGDPSAQGRGQSPHRSRDGGCHYEGREPAARGDWGRRPPSLGPGPHGGGRAPQAVEEWVMAMRLAVKQRNWEAFDVAQQELLRPVGGVPRVREIQRPKELALALWACCKAPRCDMRLVGALLALALDTGAQLLRDFNGQDHSNMWLALATLCTKRHQWRALPQDLVERVLAASAQLISGDMQRLGFKPQELSNMLWGYAKLRSAQANVSIRDTCMLEQALCGEVSARLRDTAGAKAFKEQELSNMLWACATLGIDDATLLRPLCREAAARLATERGRRAFTEQELSNMLLACAKLQLDERELVRALAEELAGRLPSGKANSQVLCNAVWALAKLDRGGWTTDPQLFFHTAAWAVLDGAVDMRDPGVVPQAWSNLFWGLATVRHYNPQFMQMTCEWLCTPQGQQHVLQRASGQACSNMLLALAHLGWSEHPRLIQLLMERLVALLHEPGQQMEVKEQDLAHSLWALAVQPPGTLGRCSPAVRALLAEVELCGANRFNADDLQQLWQVGTELAAVDAASSPPGQPGSGLHNQLLEAARKAQMQQITNAQYGPRSWLQRDVLGHAQLLMQRQGPAAVVEVQDERLVERGGLCLAVDVWLRMADGREVVVEVDGPGHFMANKGYTRRKDGGTQLRDRQLARVFGCANALCVPYWEWDSLQGEEAKVQYLAALLL